MSLPPVLRALRACQLGSGAPSPRALQRVEATPRLLQSTSSRVSSDLPWGLSCPRCLGRPLLDSGGPGVGAGGRLWIPG